MHGLACTTLHRSNTVTPSDVTFVVETRKFRLHRAVLWARCKWFKALLSAKWSNNSSVIEVTSMTASVFTIVVEFIYTSYVVAPLVISIINQLFQSMHLHIPALMLLGQAAPL